MDNSLCRTQQGTSLQVRFRQFLSKQVIPWPRRRTPNVVRVIMFGLDNSGKTRLLLRLTSTDIPYEYSTTEGFNIRTLRCGECELNIWDIGGLCTLRPYWIKYLKNADIMIYVIDSTDRKRFLEAGFELARLLNEKALHRVPLLILCNKRDLPASADATEISVLLCLQNICGRHVRIQDCSATTGLGLDEGLDWIWERADETRLRRMGKKFRSIR